MGKCIGKAYMIAQLACTMANMFNQEFNLEFNARSKKDPGEALLQGIPRDKWPLLLGVPGLEKALEKALKS